MRMKRAGAAHVLTPNPRARRRRGSTRAVVSNDCSCEQRLLEAVVDIAAKRCTETETETETEADNVSPPAPVVTKPASALSPEPHHNIIVCQVVILVWHHQQQR